MCRESRAAWAAKYQVMTTGVEIAVSGPLISAAAYGVTRAIRCLVAISLAQMPLATKSNANARDRLLLAAAQLLTKSGDQDAIHACDAQARPASRRRRFITPSAASRAEFGAVISYGFPQVRGVRHRATAPKTPWKHSARDGIVTCTLAWSIRRSTRSCTGRSSLASHVRSRHQLERYWRRCLSVKSGSTGVC